MSQDIIFQLKMQDQMSGMWSKVSTTAHRAFDSIEKDVLATKKELVELGKAGGRAFEPMSKDITAVKQQFNSLNSTIKHTRDYIGEASLAMGVLAGKVRNAFSGGGGAGVPGAAGSKGGGIFGSALGFAAGNALYGLGVQGLQMAAGGVKSVIGGGMEQSMNRKAFQVMGGGAGGNALFNELNKYAADSIFDSRIIESGKMLKNYGMANSEVMPRLKQLGDISGGDQNRLDRLITARGQVFAKGKLQGEELNQFMEAGYNPLRDMSAITGKSENTLRDMISKGQVSDKMLQAAIDKSTGQGGQFYNMLNEQANTPAGKFQAFTGGLETKAKMMGEDLMPAFGRLLDKVMPAVDNLLSGAGKFKDVIEQLMDNIGEMVKPVAELLKGVGKMLAPLYTSENMTASKNIMINILKIGKDVADILSPAFSLVGKALTFLNSGFADLTRDIASLTHFIADFLGKAGDKIDRFLVKIGLREEEKKPALWEAPRGANGTLSSIGFLMGKQTVASAAAGTISKPTSTAGDGFEKSNEAILGGGPRKIEFNIRSIIENSHITPADMKEGAAELERIVAQAVLRALSRIPQVAH